MRSVSRGPILRQQRGRLCRLTDDNRTSVSRAQSSEVDVGD